MNYLTPHDIAGPDLTNGTFTTDDGLEIEFDVDGETNTVSMSMVEQEGISVEGLSDLITFLLYLKSYLEG